MVAVRKGNAGFTLTEVMVVVVILSILAALSTPLFTRDNNVRKGRGWAKVVAQILQRARFQAMGDRANIHVLPYRTHIEVYREELPIPPATAITYTLISSTPGPYGESTPGAPTIAIWDARNDLTQPGDQNTVLSEAPAVPVSGSVSANDIVFSSLGSTTPFAHWKIYIRNELLPKNHPDAGFLINIGGLTGFVSANDHWSPSK